MKRELFKNAPLVEMFAEVKWRLTPLNAIPNGFIDPFHDAIKSSLKGSLQSLGYSIVIEKVPAQIPREFLGGQATTQYCKSVNTWPLFQIGPGVFTVNITNDYTGWSSFRETVSVGLRQLISAHPAPRMLELESLKLTAIDAFSDRHGYSTYQEFSEKYLALDSLFPRSFLEEFASDLGDINSRSDTSFPLKSPSQSKAQINITDGLSNGNKAFILQTSIETQDNIEVNHEKMMDWFDSAHDVHREMFRRLLSEDLLVILQPETIE